MNTDNRTRVERRDFVARLTQQFAANAAAALGGGQPAAPGGVRLDAGGLVWATIKAWVARLFGRG